MLHKKWFQVLSGMIFALAMIIIMYFIPPIHERLSWRVELASVYMRGVLNPIHAVSTPLYVPEDFATRTPEPASLFSPTPTPLISLTPLPPTATPTALPASASLQAPKFEQQTMNNCGPASLSEYLRA